jgi:hypothetical protein
MQMCKHHFTFDNYENITQLLNTDNKVNLLALYLAIDIRYDI